MPRAKKNTQREHGAEKSEAAELRHRLAIEELVAEMSLRFAKAAKEDLERAFDEALRDIGSFVGAERCYIVLFSSDGTSVAGIREWFADGLAPLAAVMQGKSFEQFSTAIEVLMRGEAVTVASVSSLLPAQAAAKQSWENLKVKSLAGMPLILDGRLIGFFGFSTQTAEKKWTEHDIRLLRIVSDVSLQVMARQWAASALQESERRYRSLVETSPDAIIQMDLEGRVLMANQRALQLWDISRAEEIIGHSIFDAMTPESREATRSNLPKVAQQKRPFHIERTLVRPDGTKVPIEIHSTAILDEAGRPNGIVAIYQDITERKRAESALRESERMYRTIVEIADEGIWMMNSEWKTTFVNQRLARMFGLEPSAFLGRHLLDFMDADQRERGRQNMARREKGIREQLEFKFTKANGKELWTRLSVTPLYDQGGNFSGALAMVTDINEQRRMQETINSSLERLRYFADQMADLITLVDKQGLRQYSSPSHQKVLGYSPDEMLGHSIMELVHPDDLKRVVDFYTRCALSREAGKTEFRYRAADGAYLWMESQGNWLLDTQGEIIGGLIVSRDITARKQAEDGLQASEARFISTAMLISDLLYERDLATGIAVFFGDVDSRQGYEPGGFPRDLKGWCDQLHPEDLPTFLAAYHERGKSSELGIIEYRLRRKDGSYARWRDRFIFVSDKQGKPVKFLGAAKEST